MMINWFSSEKKVLSHITSENLRTTKLVHFAPVLQHMIWLRNTINNFHLQKTCLKRPLKEDQKRSSRPIIA